MRWSALLVLAMLLPLAGCLSSHPNATSNDGAAQPPHFDASDGLYHFSLTERGVVMGKPDSPIIGELSWAPGAVGHLSLLAGGSASVDLTAAIAEQDLVGGRNMYNGPTQFLLFLVDNGTRLVGSSNLAPQTQRGLGHVSAGQTSSFLVPPSAHLLQLKSNCCKFLVDLADAHADLAWPAGRNQFVSGANVFNLEQYQNERFPHRTPGQPNYAKSQQYFAKYFTDLGYKVEVDPYGTDGLPCLPAGPCPSAAANIVATKVGTDPNPKTIFVAGGHYDMVPGTTHAAFDNTSGTACTMELARAMAPFKFHDTLKFALWGGEESGTVGSEVWVKTHPDAVANVLSYWNLDVVGMSWPAPVLKPSPVLIAAGPDVPSQANDGSTSDPVSGSLLDWAKTLQHEWLGYPDADNGTPIFRYEGVVAGQRSGYAGVNAQSDHTAFVDLGIPGYFLFNGDTLHAANPIRIHNERDTLDNMSKVSYYGAGAADLFDAPWESPAIHAAAIQALERSWEVSMWFPFYHAVLVDEGVYTPPAAAAQVPVAATGPLALS